MAKIVIIGKHGQVSHYLQKALSRFSLDKQQNTQQADQLIVLDRQQLDLSDTDKIVTVLSQQGADLIINPAAYTAVDQAEQEVDEAYLINRDAVSEIARFCAQTDTPLIHYSTDYVFNGDANSAYTEDCATSPNGIYGKSKLAGEHAVLESGAKALILRTSWVYSNQGKNFYKTMLSLSESRDELSVVSDQIGAPTYAGSIASVTASLVEIIKQQQGITQAQSGVYHFTCGGQTSWYDFAKALFAANNVTMTVHPIPSSEFPTPVKRPVFSVLDNARLQATFGLSLPDWQSALQHCASEER